MAWKHEHTQIERLMEAKGLSMAKRLQEWHESQLRTVQQLERRLFVAELWAQYQAQPGPETLTRLSHSLSIYLASPDVLAVSLFDADGQRLWTSNDALVDALPANLGPDWARQAAAQKTGWIGPWLAPDSSLRLAYFGWLATDSPQPGLMTLHMDATRYFQSVLDDWHAIEPEGRARLSAAADPASATWLTMPLNGRPWPDDGSARVMASQQGIQGTDWLLTLEVNARVVWVHVLRRGALFTLAGLLGIFSAFAVAYLLLQRRTLAMREQALERLQQSQQELASSESRYRLLAENAADVVWLLDLHTQRFVYLSPAVERMTGFTPQEVMERPLEALILPDSLARLRAMLASYLQRFQAGDPLAAQAVLELELYHKNGTAVAAEISARLVADDSGQAVQAQGVTRDLSERRRSEHQIRMLSQATEQSPVSVIITNSKGRIEYVNPAFERMSGYTRDEVLGRNPRLLQSARTSRETYRRMWDALLQGQPWQGELVNKRKDGSHYLQSVTIAPLRNERQEVMQYISVQMVITAQRAAEVRLELLAWFDPLTGLPNRQRLLEDISQALEERSLRPDHMGLVIMNVDRFKAINDALGRASGDQVLQAVGDRLRPLMQQGDILAHLNGDEFGMLVPHLGEDVAMANAALLRRAGHIHRLLETPLQLPNNTLAVTMSVGITLLGMAGDDSPVEALRRADTALHRAKEAGGHQTAFFDAGMGQLASERFAIEQDLRRGMEAGELRLYLQPQVDNEGRLVGAEALVRWAHPQKGLISPALFIPVAENSGLISPIGQWVLEEVCRLLAQLQQAGQRL
ncbi:MAG: PAS domain S-box protein, partial [Burkholderiaceae bacterium]|nr:PAS domain S-box protein [Burkholderiaceae bacterium]